MKKNFLLAIALFCCVGIAFTQTHNNPLITIIIKNKSVLPKKCTIIAYAPNETGNSTQGFWFLPGGTKKIKFKEGTKLYLANQQQVYTVMSGKRIDNEEPFLVVNKTDNNKTFKF
jgi:hypothetical protein